jgi:glutamyl-tRNA reductase
VRKREDETYEAWCKRVEMYEHGWAMQRIAEGVEIEKVLEEMSRRITQKLLHPLYDELRKASDTKYDVETSRKEYEEKYLKTRTLVADHVEGQVFDKPE